MESTRSARRHSLKLGLSMTQLEPHWLQCCFRHLFKGLNISSFVEGASALILLFSPLFYRFQNNAAFSIDFLYEVSGVVVA